MKWQQITRRWRRRVPEKVQLGSMLRVTPSAGMLRLCQGRLNLKSLFSQMLLIVCLTWMVLLFWDKQPVRVAVHFNGFPE